MNDPTGGKKARTGHLKTHPGRVHPPGPSPPTARSVCRVFPVEPGQLERSPQDGHVDGHHPHPETGERRVHPPVHAFGELDLSVLGVERGRPTVRATSLTACGAGPASCANWPIVSGACPASRLDGTPSPNCPKPDLPGPFPAPAPRPSSIPSADSNAIRNRPDIVLASPRPLLHPAAPAPRRPCSRPWRRCPARRRGDPPSRAGKAAQVNDRGARSRPAPRW